MSLFDENCELINTLFNQYKLDGWSWELDNAKRRFGCCHYSKKLITLSKEYVKTFDTNRIRLTILHEIAHMLVGFSEHHNKVWKQKCIEIGGNGKRCGTGKFTMGKYNLICIKCNKVLRQVHRRTNKDNKRSKCCKGKLDFVLN